MDVIKSPRILVADDESMHLRAVCDSLGDCGYDTTGCASGNEALEAMQKQQFDLLLTDLMMPGMDGVTLLDKALKMDPQIACILMTGMGTIDSAVRAMKAGAQDYILKPFKLSTLLPVITRALNFRQLKLENLDLKNTVAIHELNQAIAHTQDTDDLLNKIADAAMAQFDADEASVMLADEDGSSLLIAAVRGAGREKLLGTRVSIGAGIAGWVAGHNDPQVFEGEVTDAHLKPVFPRKEIQSALSIPMISRSKLVGVLNVNCLHRRGVFTVGQIKVLSIFTNAAASAIEAARLHDAQHKSDSRYREVLDMVADAIVSCDEDMHILVFNHAAQIIFGYETTEAFGQSIDLLLPDGIQLMHRLSSPESVLDPEQPLAPTSRTRMTGLRSDGTEFPVEVGISKRIEKDKTLFTAVIRDITHRVQQEERIARMTRLYAVLSGVNATVIRVQDELDIFAEICRITTEKGEFMAALVGKIDTAAGCLEIVANSGFELTTRSLPIPAETNEDEGSLAKTMRLKVVTYSNHSNSELAPCCSKLLGLDARSVAYLPFLANNKVQAVMLIYARDAYAFHKEEFKLLRELAGDVSFALDYIAKTSHLEYLANYDLLTDLPNRTLFMDRLKQAVATSQYRSTPLAAMVFDLEHFRLVNETFGRQGGDILLRQLATRVHARAPGRANVARIGPDIFAAMHQSFTQPEEVASSVSEGMDNLFVEPFEIDGQSVHIAARAGISFFPSDGEDADTLLKNAEAALNRAKSGKERMVLYTADLNARIAERLALESKLRGALERHEFLLFYQPKVDIVSGQIIGLEALLRWQDPEQGLVSPDKFIGLLEESGLILSVGNWVMQEAARTAVKLRALGMPLRIAVNVSPLQLRDNEFVKSVAEAITVANQLPHGLDLEITESVIMHDIDANVNKLVALRNMQVGVAIDDFGTGYSSLAYIARLPVDLIKIDRAFIRHLETDNDSETIVQTIISLSHALRMKVIAEGVENEAQLQALREMRCDYYQGFLYSKPLPLESIEKLLMVASSMN